MTGSLRAYQVFVTVVEQQNISKSAKLLNLSPSAVSKQLALLEERLSTRLVDRSTRSVVVTDAGRAFYRDCREILRLSLEAEEKVKESHGAIQGDLTLSVPHVLLTSAFTRLLKKFRDANPNVKLNLQVSDEPVNLIEEQVDFAFRIGHLRDSRLKAVYLVDTTPLLCATPAFVEEHGFPARMQDVDVENLLLPTYLNVGEKIRAMFPSQRVSAQLGNALEQCRGLTNSAQALYQMVRSDMGFAFLLDIMVAEDLIRGQLVQLLPDLKLPAQKVYMIFTKKDYSPKKEKAFIEFIKNNKQDLDSAAIELRELAHQ